MQFILFSLYFSYYYEANMLKNIINLSLKEPKYSDVIKFLKDKKQDDNAFLINYITQMEQESKSERIMTSIILGQSLMLSDIGIKFVKDFYNTMSKSKTKISVSVYDTLRSQNKINNIIPFFSTSNTKPEEISNYNSSNYYKKMKYNKTDEQNMDFDKILDFGLNQFSKYDVGIKKKIIIVCDENIFTKKKYYINNKLINLNNAKHMKLIENLIDLIIISPQNYEKGEVHELFNSKMLSKKKEEEIPYSIFENHFHVSNLNRTEIFMNDLGRVIKDSHIKMKVGKKIINDFNQGKMTYYKIYNKEFKSYVIVIKANFSNFNFYSSIEHPFPNSNTGNLLQKREGAIVIPNGPNGTIYLGIEPKKTLQKQVIEIFTCESYKPDNNCQFIGDYRNQWFIFFGMVFTFNLFIIIYKFKRSNYSELNKNDKKRLNVFDKVK